MGRLLQMPGTLEELQAQEYGAKTVRVRIERMAESLTVERPTADAVAGERLAGLIPKRGRGAGTEGALRLWRLLHLIAVYTAEQRGQRPSAMQAVYHSTVEVLAATLRVCTRTVTRWTAELVRAGVIQARPQYGSDRDSAGQVVTRITGTVYAVALQPDHIPRLTYADLHHRYRNLTADREAGRTAYSYAKRIDALYDAEKFMSESTDTRQGEVGGKAGDANPSQAWERAVGVLGAWAVTPGGGETYLDPRYSVDSDIFQQGEKTPIQTVIYNLPLIAAEADSGRRRVLVHQAAGSIAHALNDSHSLAFYAGLIWQALKRGWSGLELLAAALTRFEVDRREWGHAMRRPAALLTSRIA